MRVRVGPVFLLACGTSVLADSSQHHAAHDVHVVHAAHAGHDGKGKQTSVLAQLTVRMTHPTTLLAQSKLTKTSVGLEKKVL